MAHMYAWRFGFASETSCSSGRWILLEMKILITSDAIKGKTHMEENAYINTWINNLVGDVKLWN